MMHRPAGISGGERAQSSRYILQRTSHNSNLPSISGEERATAQSSRYVCWRKTHDDWTPCNMFHEGGGTFPDSRSEGFLKCLPNAQGDLSREGQIVPQPALDHVKTQSRRSLPLMYPPARGFDYEWRLAVVAASWRSLRLRSRRSSAVCRPAAELSREGRDAWSPAATPATYSVGFAVNERSVRRDRMEHTGGYYILYIL